MLPCSRCDGEKKPATSAIVQKYEVLPRRPLETSGWNLVSKAAVETYYWNLEVGPAVENCCWGLLSESCTSTWYWGLQLKPAAWTYYLIWLWNLI